jgi:hypothetical protein
MQRHNLPLCVYFKHFVQNVSCLPAVCHDFKFLKDVSFNSTTVFGFRITDNSDEEHESPCSEEACVCHALAS